MAPVKYQLRSSMKLEQMFQDLYTVNISRNAFIRYVNL